MKDRRKWIEAWFEANPTKWVTAGVFYHEEEGEEGVGEDGVGFFTAYLQAFFSDLDLVRGRRTLSRDLRQLFVDGALWRMTRLWAHWGSETRGFDDPVRWHVYGVEHRHGSVSIHQVCQLQGMLGRFCRVS